MMLFMNSYCGISLDAIKSLSTVQAVLGEVAKQLIWFGGGKVGDAQGRGQEDS